MWALYGNFWAKRDHQMETSYLKAHQLGNRYPEWMPNLHSDCGSTVPQSVLDQCTFWGYYLGHENLGQGVAGWCHMGLGVELNIDVEFKVKHLLMQTQVQGVLWHWPQEFVQVSFEAVHCAARYIPHCCRENIRNSGLLQLKPAELMQCLTVLPSLLGLSWPTFRGSSQSFSHSFLLVQCLLLHQCNGGRSSLHRIFLLFLLYMYGKELNLFGTGTHFCYKF